MIVLLSLHCPTQNRCQTDWMYHNSVTAADCFVITAHWTNKQCVWIVSARICMASMHTVCRKIGKDWCDQSYIVIKMNQVVSVWQTKLMHAPTRQVSLYCPCPFVQVLGHKEQTRRLQSGTDPAPEGPCRILLLWTVSDRIILTIVRLTHVFLNLHYKQHTYSMLARY